MKVCDNCAWYCHADKKCYKPDLAMPAETWPEDWCYQWQSDGLEDWEREGTEVLVTMETA